MLVAAEGAVEIPGTQPEPGTGRLSGGAVEYGTDAVQVKGNPDLLMEAAPAMRVINKTRANSIDESQRSPPEP